MAHCNLIKVSARQYDKTIVSRSVHENFIFVPKAYVGIISTIDQLYLKYLFWFSRAVPRMGMGAGNWKIYWWKKRYFSLKKSSHFFCYLIALSKRICLIFFTVIIYQGRLFWRSEKIIFLTYRSKSFASKVNS